MAWGWRWAPSSRIPEKLCINVWGDAAIGFTAWISRRRCGERLPILSILLNNSSMAIELDIMPVATEKYRSTDISGHYADFARALGGYGERVTASRRSCPRSSAASPPTERGQPALIEFITSQEQEFSRL
ncbi:MAG: thiamine pyrophosphate-dependent enzyme [Sphingomonas sp.]